MLITDRTEIEKHVHTEVWNETYSEGIALNCETKWDFYPSIEDALDSESTKQGLHIYVTLCFDK